MSELTGATIVETVGRNNVGTTELLQAVIDVAKEAKNQVRLLIMVLNLNRLLEILLMNLRKQILLLIHCVGWLLSYWKPILM